MKVLAVSGPPKDFSGVVTLPPSKSYLHRALFVSCLLPSGSKITGCGKRHSSDVSATVGALKKLGGEIRFLPKEGGGTFLARRGKPVKDGKIEIDCRGSGTTARLAISYAALSPKGTTLRIFGDGSLTRRPMESIFSSLHSLGVQCRSENSSGTLPVLVEGGGIPGGECEIDGSVSSQFISSLLISCTRAQNKTKIRIKDPSKLVSKPYIASTLLVLEYFGFKAAALGDGSSKFAAFEIPGNQAPSPKNRTFKVPGDASSAAALVSAAIASSGEIEILNYQRKMPQPDSKILEISRELGAEIRENPGGVLKIDATRVGSSSKKAMKLDLGDSPDLVPVVAALAADRGINLEITNVAHVRFKESDRLTVLSRELGKLGISTTLSPESLELRGGLSNPRERKPILLDPEKDHRMLMALAVAGLSGKFGKILIKDPGCVAKSYPNFVKDIRRLCHGKNVVITART